MISPSVPVMSLFGIYRSSSLLWLRRRTCCNASVPVTGGPISAELLHRQLDLVTGTAALLAAVIGMRERAPSARALGVAAGQAQDLESLGGSHCPEASGTCHTPRHLGRTASRGVLSHRHVPRTAAAAPPAAEAEVRRHQFSALAASDVPACTRVLARTLPACCQCGAVCRISHSSPRHLTWLPLLHRPAPAGLCGLPGRARGDWFRHGPPRFRHDALDAGGDDDRAGLRDGPRAHVAGQPNRRGRDDAQLDPDAAGLARLRGPVAPASRRNIARLGGLSRTG